MLPPKCLTFSVCAAYASGARCSSVLSGGPWDPAQRRSTTAPTFSASSLRCACCVCCVCVRACMRVLAVHVCVRVCTRVHACTYKCTPPTD